MCRLKTKLTYTWPFLIESFFFPFSFFALGKGWKTVTINDMCEITKSFLFERSLATGFDCRGGWKQYVYISLLYNTVFSLTYENREAHFFSYINF